MCIQLRSYDLDLDTDLDFDILKMYLHAKNEVCRSSLQKLEAQEDRDTHVFAPVTVNLTL